MIRRRSVKLRVTLWFTLMMALVMAVGVGTTFVMAEREVALDLREDLTDAVQESFDEITWKQGKFVINGLDTMDHYVYLTVLDGEKHQLRGRPPSDVLEPPPLRTGAFQTVHGERDRWYVYDEYRTVEPVTAKKSVWVRGMVSASSRESAFDALLRLALLIFPGIVLLTASASYLMVERAFLPVRRMTAIAEGIIDGTDLRDSVGVSGGSDEIYRMGEAFDAMLGRLHRSFERERQFASDVSHELRTPTTVMISQCEYALEHAETLEDAKEALSTVLGQAERMSALVGQLLTLTRVDKGADQLKRERINLSELSEMVAAQISESADGKRIAVHTRIEPDLYVSGDETMLMRLLLNLMENGVRYGREGGNLTLTLRRHGGVITGTVADDGIGIAPEHLTRIWDRLYQVDPARSSGGIGLGLPMVKHIAEVHGGTVSVESEPGEGSVFTFTLPAEEQAG